MPIQDTAIQTLIQARMNSFPGEATRLSNIYILAEPIFNALEIDYPTANKFDVLKLAISIATDLQGRK